MLLATESLDDHGTPADFLTTLYSNRVPDGARKSATGGEAMGTYEEQMAEVLRPVAPPRVLEGVYTDDQHERLLGIVKRHGPWPTITVAPLRDRRRAGRDHDRRGAREPRAHARRHRVAAVPGLLRAELGLLLPRARRLLLQRRVPRHREAVLGRGLRQADDDAVQHLRSAPVARTAVTAPRRGHVPRRALSRTRRCGCRTHGEVGALRRLPREDGPGHHVVVPGRERHVHVLARRPVRRAARSSSTRSGTRASSCRTR